MQNGHPTDHDLEQQARLCLAREERIAMLQLMMKARGWDGESPPPANMIGDEVIPGFTVTQSTRLSEERSQRASECNRLIAMFNAGNGDIDPVQSAEQYLNETARKLEGVESLGSARRARRQEPYTAQLTDSRGAVASFEVPVTAGLS